MIWINVIKSPGHPRGLYKPVVGKFVVTEGVLEFGERRGLRKQPSLSVAGFPSSGDSCEAQQETLTCPALQVISICGIKGRNYWSVTGRKCLGTTSGCSYRKNISRMHIQRVILVFLIFTSGHWLQSMRLLRVRHDWATSPSLFTFMHWRRKWQPTPVFLPGESQGGGAWWAAVYGVAQSWTRLKRLSSSSSGYLEAIKFIQLSFNIIFCLHFSTFFKPNH